MFFRRRDTHDDVVYATGLNDVIYATGLNDVIYATALNDVIYATALNDASSFLVLLRVDKKITGRGCIHLRHTVMSGPLSKITVEPALLANVVVT